MDFGRELSLEEPGGPSSAPRMEGQRTTPYVSRSVGGGCRKKPQRGGSVSKRGKGTFKEEAEGGWCVEGGNCRWRARGLDPTWPTGVSGQVGPRALQLPPLSSSPSSISSKWLLRPVLPASSCLRKLRENHLGDAEVSRLQQDQRLLISQ